MNPALIIVIVIVVVAVIFVIGLYNGLVQRRLRIDEAFAQIEVQLKRRHDLIPNLVNAVKGYMGFEQKVLTDVTNARAAAVAAGAQGPAAQAAGRKRPDRDAPLAVRRRRELPGAQGQRERPVAPGAADHDREPDLVQPPALQRQRPRLQHGDPDLPECADRRHVRLHQARVLRRRARGGERPERRPQPELSEPTRPRAAPPISGATDAEAAPSTARSRRIDATRSCSRWSSIALLGGARVRDRLRASSGSSRARWS